MSSQTQQEQRPAAPASTAPKYGTLVHFEIPANDPAKISKFYSQLFGWKFNKWEGQGADEMPYWLIQHKDANDPTDTLGGLFKKQQPNQNQFLNYFLVKSIEDSTKQATNLGAKVVMAKQEIPNIGWFSVLTDPEGVTFALFQSSGLGM
ncbi:MAG TPA: VOC family protein [Candidatus Binatus sp.]|nr:VOC family protein [Candidatus Binatus sp.]